MSSYATSSTSNLIDPDELQWRSFIFQKAVHSFNTCRGYPWMVGEISSGSNYETNVMLYVPDCTEAGHLAHTSLTTQNRIFPNFKVSRMIRKHTLRENNKSVPMLSLTMEYFLPSRVLSYNVTVVQDESLRGY